MKNTKNSRTYWSLNEFADVAVKYGSKASGNNADGNNAERYYRMPRDWNGNTNLSSAASLARNGWNAELDSALDVAESAVDMAEKEHMVDSFNQPVWDVTGAQVDVGAYLAGTPECMIDYPLSTTSKVGRVITLCASACYSGSVSAETIERRGYLMVALALALSKLGHAVEYWADISSENREGGILRQRILVKGANDELDPSRIMFAYAHPAMLRVVEFATREQWRGQHPPSRCHPIPPAQDLPEGTIYLPEICSDSDVPDADKFLRQYLGELGLLAE